MVSSNLDDNIAVAKRLLAEVATGGAQLMVLPETFAMPIARHQRVKAVKKNSPVWSQTCSRLGRCQFFKIAK